MAVAEPQRGYWPSSRGGQEEDRGRVVIGSRLHCCKCSSGSRSPQFPCSFQYGRRSNCRSDASNGEQRSLTNTPPLHTHTHTLHVMWSSSIRHFVLSNDSISVHHIHIKYHDLTRMKWTRNGVSEGSIKANWHALCVVMYLWPTLNWCTVLLGKTLIPFWFFPSVHAHLHYQWTGGPRLLLWGLYIIHILIC